MQDFRPLNDGKAIKENKGINRFKENVILVGGMILS